MAQLDDLLEERLARLEAGEPLEACLAGLPEEEAILLKKAALLRALPETHTVPEQMPARRQDFLRQARETKKMASQPSTSSSKARPRWILPAALAGSALVLISCVTIFALLAGMVGLNWFRQTRNVALEAPDPQTAVLQEMHGLVEVQASDGNWSQALAGTLVKAGERVRTGGLSSVTLAFYDGSEAAIGPQAEVSVDQLDAQKEGARVVVLTQWLGESDHDVATSSNGASQYTVNTPSGSGTAKGTVFHVVVSSTQVVSFDVDEGAVEVTNLNVTVIVIAGQSTVIVAGQPPEQPVFQMKGEGTVEEISPTSWRIAGRTFLINENTVLVGQPQVGDRVAFKARILPDGTLIADRISLLEQVPNSRFTFAGTVDAISEMEWTIAGRVVQVDQLSNIDTNIQIGTLVEVRGSIDQDGTLRATRIRRLEDATGQPFEFVGVVESVTETVWEISGVSITIDANTQVESGVVVGDTVQVRGRILDDGTWQATSIQRAPDTEQEFVIVGPVESLEPWRVAGVEFETDSDTEIDDGIGVGDRVRVVGRILEDGRWVAIEIHLLNQAETQQFTFTGLVTSIDPWVVGGIPLTVDADTVIDNEIMVGTLVRVRGVILPDGTWLAKRIRRLDQNQGCFSFSTVVVQVDANQIVLPNGQTIPLSGEIEVRGQLQENMLIIVSGCVQSDGTLIIVTIIVIGPIEVTPVPATPTPIPPTVVPATIVPPTQAPPPTVVVPPPSSGSIVITDNNQTLTLNCSGSSVTVNGNDNTITLFGTCASLTVRGNNNRIFLEAATSVTNTGNNNIIQQR